jgi:hypothetical protein
LLELTAVFVFAGDVALKSTVDELFAVPRNEFENEVQPNPILDRSITEMRILCKAAKWGPNILFFISNRTRRILCIMEAKLRLSCPFCGRAVIKAHAYASCASIHFLFTPNQQAPDLND